MSLAFSELVTNERQERIRRLLLTLTACLHLDGRADARRQHHHAHDTFGVHPALAFGQPHFAGEAARQFGELGGGSGVRPSLLLMLMGVLIIFLL